ncbi:MAG: YbhB/YbcL family Raf kinase inhibitor-like protein [Minisyncoccia bacterium]
MKKFLIILVCLTVIFVAALVYFNIQKTPLDSQKMMPDKNLKTPMKITSQAFQNNELIPKRYTCDGENINPPLYFEEIPEGTESLVLIVDDPDAPRGTFLHWLVFNIPPQTKLIEENSLPAGAQLGKNDFGQLKYGGPCPPYGTHRYLFKIFALDKKIDLKEGASLSEVLSAMRNHILADSELIGLYQRE